MGRSRVVCALVWAVALWSTRAAADETVTSSKWRTVCTLTGDELSFSDATVELGGASHAAERVHAAHATVVIEVDGVQARVRAHATAPFDFTLTTKNFGGASLSLRAGAHAGVVKAEADGAVRLQHVNGKGGAMTVTAGSLTISDLPLRCEDLVAAPAHRYWLLGAMTDRVHGLQRIYATPGGVGFSVAASDPVIVSASETAPGEWRHIRHFGTADGKPGFSVDGWVRSRRFTREETFGAGGAMADPGFRSCARGAPARMGYATLPAGTALFDGASGGKAWTELTAPVRALVALYPRDRAALAGLPGWQWPRARCEMAWIDPAGLLLETSLSAPASAQE